MSIDSEKINNLTITELETLVVQIVKQVLKEERAKTKSDRLPEELLATFNSWEDERSSNEIINEIYANRKLLSTRSTGIKAQSKAPEKHRK